MDTQPNTVLAFDTETTGLPEWKEPSDSEGQPHLVQLGAILIDLDSREEIDSLDVIIKPEGWEIPAEVSEIHGITTERALECGIPEKEAVARLLNLWMKHGSPCRRVAHNRTFDQRILRIATKRYCDDETVDRWACKDNFDCTMLMSKPVLKLGPKGRYGYKNPKLEEAYEYFTGKKLENAHTAMADARGCMDVYLALLDLQSNEAVA